MLETSPAKELGNRQNGIAELNFDSTIDKGLVHKVALAEVFVTDYCIEGGGMLVAAQLPIAHKLYNETLTQRHDVFAIVEVCRQTALVVAHEKLGIPKSWPFIFRSAKLRVGDIDSLKIHEGKVVINVRIEKTFSRGRFPTGFSANFDVYIDSRAVGEFFGSISFLPKSQMKELRSTSRARKILPNKPYISQRTPVPAVEIGRKADENVVVSSVDTQTFEILGHITNPAIVDHHVDHISGMLLIEAIRQTAVAKGKLDTGKIFSVVSALEINFVEFAEHELPAVCQIKSVNYEEDFMVVEVEVVQDQEIIASAKLDLTKGVENVWN